MIKVNKKMLKQFLQVMEDYNEFVFGEEKEIKEQLEMLLNRQGYWSGCRVNIFYDKDLKKFYASDRW